jgi:phosphotransferase system enzyme I (PtsI)
MSFVLHGIPIGGGIAIGRAHLLQQSMDDVPHYAIEEEELAAEMERYVQAIKETRRQLEKLRSNIPENAPTELGAFISLHLMLLADVSLSREPADIIQEYKVNAEWALKLQADRLSEQFEAIDDEYLRQRKQDMLQVVERIFNSLRGLDLEFGPNNLFDDTILIAHDISPADTVLFKDNRIAAFVTDVGGPTSHMAILGRSLDIPSVIAVHNAKELLVEDDWVIVDGIDGVLIVQPDDAILAEYRKRARAYRSQKRQLTKLKHTTATTLDGLDVQIMANIESSEDITQVNKVAADGIGLFRSEFMFMNRDVMPTEDEQYDIYASVIKKMKGKHVTVRTIDLGVDKNPRWFDHNEALNPALGLTGIRLCLAEPVMFRTQMRAILRASAHGPINMMLPMISSVTELRQAITHLDMVKIQLRDAGIEFNENMHIGAMIEIPSAALSVNALLKHLDFISIGTNDLIQYTLAVDRSDDSVSYLYQPAHPAVLKLVNHIIKTATRMGKDVSICGEMAGDSKLTRLLLNMGLRRFSMHPSHILSVKNIIVNTNTMDMEAKAQKILRNDDPDKIDDLLKKLNNVDCQELQKVD